MSRLTDGTDDAVLSLRGVGKVYPPELRVLHGVDLTIRRGELVGLVGPSGSGKSTLLHIMGTLDRATSGHVEIVGTDVEALTDRALAMVRAHHIGFVFQQFFLIDSLDARDNVALPLVYRSMPLHERRELAGRTLERVGLGHRKRHRPNQLSGGERQRVAIARALVTEPAIVLADEPTGNLDSASGAGVMDLLMELHSEGHTIVVITHDRSVADRCPRRVEILDGRIATDSGVAKADTHG
jgi:putative ABC transport system ATP-binding protein